jgi:hypothetical protein
MLWGLNIRTFKSIFDHTQNPKLISDVMLKHAANKVRGFLISWCFLLFIRERPIKKGGTDQV